MDVERMRRVTSINGSILSRALERMKNETDRYNETVNKYVEGSLALVPEDLYGHPLVSGLFVSRIQKGGESYVALLRRLDDDCYLYDYILYNYRDSVLSSPGNPVIAVEYRGTECHRFAPMEHPPRRPTHEEMLTLIKLLKEGSFDAAIQRYSSPVAA